jgi:hypothetical protein
MTEERPSTENGGIEIVPPQEVRLTSAQKYTEEVRQRLGITQEGLSKQHVVSHWFENIGGKEMAVEYLRGSQDEEASKLLYVYDNLSDKEKQHLTFEDFCVASGVRSEDMLASIVKNVVPQSEKISAIMAAKFHPAVVQKTYEMAMTDRGIKDRELLHKHAGFIPVPKGAQIAVQVNNQQVSNNQKEEFLPPIELDIKNLSEGFQKLGSGKKTIEGK